MRVKTPTELLRGDALREAAATDFRDIHSLVNEAVKNYYKSTSRNGSNVWICTEALSADVVVIKIEDSARYYRHTYTLTDANQVVLGEAVEVTKDFTPVLVGSPVSPAGNGGSVFVEAKNDQGTLWEIRVIDAGRSLNNVEYPAAVLL